MYTSSLPRGGMLLPRARVRASPESGFRIEDFVLSFKCSFSICRKRLGFWVIGLGIRISGLGRLEGLGICVGFGDPLASK